MPSGVSTPPKVTLDIDRDNSYDALTDGMLIVRHLSGLTSNALLAGALGANATRFMAADITQYLDGIQPALNVDGDLLSESPTDGLLVLRYLLGLRGTALTTGALGAAEDLVPRADRNLHPVADAVGVRIVTRWSETHRAGSGQMPRSPNSSPHIRGSSSSPAQASARARDPALPRRQRQLAAAARR